MRTTLLLLSLALCATSCSDYKLEKLAPDPVEGLPELDTAVVVPDTSDPPIDLPPEDTAEDTPEPSSPVAVCDVTPNPISPPFETATWIGTDSYDPDGAYITDYAWSLTSQPVGSSLTMPIGGPNRGPFTPILAGNYTGELTVTNEHGLTSDPCEATLEAIPTESLWVEMFWSEFQDDMDLHLLVDGGSLETRDDCYYSNCTSSAQMFFPMDWGAAGYTGDNPMLDLDDIPGTGPENINIDTPHPGAVYTVVVHDYTGSTTDVYGDNEVTVNIYLDGSLAWTNTKVIACDGSYTYYATIDWTAGTITSL